MGSFNKTAVKGIHGLLTKLRIGAIQDYTLNQYFDENFSRFYLFGVEKNKNWYSIYNNHIRRGLGEIKISDLDNIKLFEWRKNMINQNFKPQTINKHIDLLNRVLRQCALEHSYFLNKKIMPIEKMKVAEFRQYFMSKQEIKCLLAASENSKNSYLRDFILLALTTGARHGELTAAKRAEIDFAKKVWRIGKSKGGRARTVTLNDSSIQAIKRIYSISKKARLIKNSEYLFVNPNTKDGYKSFDVPFRVAKLEAGLPNLRIHDLRHTYASILINSGASLYEVQKLLGHTSPQLTQRYAHLSNDALQSARVRIHNQNMTTAAKAHAERKTFGHLS